MLRVPSDYFNPYAVGHFVNHPPPDTAANVKFIDFDLPYTFFPSYLGRYLPYMNCQDIEIGRNQTSETRSKETLRAVAMVSQQTIAHGDELFADYIADKRTEIDYTPDWLIQPPEPSPYLKKKEMLSPIPLAVRMLIMWDQTKKGRIYEEFEGRTMKELPPVQAQKRKELA